MRYDVGTTTLYSLFNQAYGDSVLKSKSAPSAFLWIATCDYVVTVDNDSMY